MNPMDLIIFILEIKNSSIGHFKTTIKSSVPEEIDKNTAFKILFFSVELIIHPITIPMGTIKE